MGVISTSTSKSIEVQESTSAPVAEAPRSQSGRDDSVNLVEEVEKDSEDKPVVIVASSGTESESTTKPEIEESSTEQEIVAAFSPTPATKKRKFNRFSSNRDKIRKRLRQKIKGKKVTIDALSLVRNRQQE